MLSGIYKINFPNQKSYIGLSCNIEQRIKSHNNSAKNPKYPVHKAIKKYFGQITLSENVEILEEIDSSNREYMQEREKYWIDFYRTFLDKEQGYNLTPGGDGASLGINNFSAKLDQESLNQIYDLLLNSNYYIYQISELFLISPEAVSKINNGKSYFNENLTYPLRESTKFKKGRFVEKGCKNHLSKLNEAQVDEIYKLLELSNLSLYQIAQQYNISYTIISMINRGLRYNKNNYEYPIRKGNKGNEKIDRDTLLLIINDIENSKISLAKIAEKYMVSKDTIYRINKGETYYQKNTIYPLRKKIK